MPTDEEAYITDGYNAKYKGDTADTNALTQAFRQLATGAMPKDAVDSRDIEQLLTSDNTTIRKHWTPDVEFLKKYKSGQLDKLAAKLKIKSVKGWPKKKQKVECLAAAFSNHEGTTDEWIPKL